MKPTHYSDFELPLLELVETLREFLIVDSFITSIISYNSVKKFLGANRRHKIEGHSLECIPSTAAEKNPNTVHHPAGVLLPWWTVSLFQKLLPYMGYQIWLLYAKRYGILRG